MRWYIMTKYHADINHGGHRTPVIATEQKPIDGGVIVRAIACGGACPFYLDNILFMTSSLKKTFHGIRL